MIPRDGWRRRAACLGTSEPLWDDRLDPETDHHREYRHNRAKAICRGECPVRAECSADADWQTDEGVRGGYVLPPLDRQRNLPEDKLLRLLQEGLPLDEAARRV